MKWGCRRSRPARDRVCHAEVNRAPDQGTTRSAERCHGMHSAGVPGAPAPPGVRAAAFRRRRAGLLPPSPRCGERRCHGTRPHRAMAWRARWCREMSSDVFATQVSVLPDGSGNSWNDVTVFWSSDLRNWNQHPALTHRPDEAMFNTSVCPTPERVHDGLRDHPPRLRELHDPLRRLRGPAPLAPVAGGAVRTRSLRGLPLPALLRSVPPHALPRAPRAAGASRRGWRAPATSLPGRCRRTTRSLPPTATRAATTPTPTSWSTRGGCTCTMPRATSSHGEICGGVCSKAA